ncbi:MAG: selenium cofactor biosynthesis protein YqeC [Desulfomonilaceae bacterium]
MEIIFNTFSDLLEALEIDSNCRTIAIVGAGGKTTLMYALAKNLTNKGKTVISTTSTKIFPPDKNQSGGLILIEEMSSGIHDLSNQVQAVKHLSIGRRIDPVSGKVLGVTSNQVFPMLSWADHVIIEADGAAGRPIKCPLATEPVVPDFVDLVIVVIGLDSLLSIANNLNVFRLEEFLKVTGMTQGEIIGVPEITKLLNAADGALRNIPYRARISILFNKLDKLDNIHILKDLSRSILSTISDHRLNCIVSGILKPKPAKLVGFRRCLC